MHRWLISPILGKLLIGMCVKSHFRLSADERRGPRPARSILPPGRGRRSVPCTRNCAPEAGAAEAAAEIIEAPRFIAA
jgi:hypothetical protein